MLESQASVTVKLDTTDAQRRVSELEKRLEKGKKDAGDIKNLATGRSTGVSGRLKATDARSVPEKMVDMVDKKRRGRSVSGRMVDMAVARAAPEASLISSALQAVKPVAFAAAGYAAVSAAAQISPVALEAMKGMLPSMVKDTGAFKFLESSLENLRNGFSTLESGVKSIFTAAGKTAEVANAGMRLTGQIPNLPFYYDTFHKADTYESRLEKKFTEFKNKEAAAVIGKELGELVRGSLMR